MLKLNPYNRRLPIGGHHYASHGITFRGDTVDDVVKQVTEFRITNHIPVGWPHQEVLQFYAKHWPYMVARVDDECVEAMAARGDDYVEWRDWVQKMWKQPQHKLIPTREAKDRWDKCLQCPYNRTPKWGETDEEAAYVRQVFMLRRGIAVPQMLGYCALHRADLSLFSILENPKEASCKKDNEEFDLCWVRSLAGQ